ncbi:MAG: hypothetical protein HZA89_07755 [Verrucomicrobia bacterium]|nr:hypothetical protein [Verrucomicrobiota bacterium]
MKFNRKTKIIIGIGAGLLCVLLLGFAIPQFTPGGAFFKRTKVIEKLESPIAASSWSEEGLVLADGRQIQLPGFAKLPKTSTALAEATKRGIEISTDGRVVGLVKVHHWCGNDRVGEHIARVDIARMLTFLGEGELETALTDEEKSMFLPPRESRFSEFGWNVSDFAQFSGWSRFLTERSTSLNAALVSKSKQPVSP